MRAEGNERADDRSTFPAPTCVGRIGLRGGYAPGRQDRARAVRQQAVASRAEVRAAEMTTLYRRRTTMRLPHVVATHDLADQKPCTVPHKRTTTARPKP